MAQLGETDCTVNNPIHHTSKVPGAPPIVWVACMGAVLVSAWMALVPLEGMPHVTDEIAYTLQAKLFANGERFGPQPDNETMWMLPFWNASGPSFSPFPWGWPVVLAIGEAVGLPSLMNPMLVGVLPWLVFRIGTGAGGERLGTTAALLVACSPGVWLMAASRMAHTSVLIALGVLMMVSVERRWTVTRAGLGAIAAAYVVVARPFDAALLGVPLLLLGAVSCPPRLRVLWFGLPVLSGALVLVDNWWITGSPTTFPMSVWFDQWQGRQGCNRLGFGADVGCSPTLGSYGHSLAKAWTLAGQAALRFDVLLVGVPGASVLALFGAWSLKARKGVVWVALIVAGYALYWSPGRAYGARFWHPMYLVVPVALAAALRGIPLRMLGVCLLAAVGWRMGAVLPEVSAGYWCVDGELRDRLEAEEITEGVVFLLGEGRRPEPWPALGVERFACDPMLEAGDAWAIADPTRMTGGLQFRHALRDPADVKAYMIEFHEGQAAYLVRHNIADNTRIIEELGTFSSH